MNYLFPLSWLFSPPLFLLKCNSCNSQRNAFLGINYHIAWIYSQVNFTGQCTRRGIFECTICMQTLQSVKLVHTKKYIYMYIYIKCSNLTMAKNSMLIIMRVRNLLKSLRSIFILKKYLILHSLLLENLNTYILAERIKKTQPSLTQPNLSTELN